MTGYHLTNFRRLQRLGWANETVQMDLDMSECGLIFSWVHCVKIQGGLPVGIHKGSDKGGRARALRVLYSKSLSAEQFLDNAAIKCGL